MRNYEKAIADIDSLSQLVNYDIGHTGDGKYHLLFLKGLCYSGLGSNEKAIEIMKSCFIIEDYLIGVYDYLHLGVLYLETGQISNALEMFEKQIEYNPVAGVYYYYSIALEKNCQKDEALK